MKRERMEGKNSKGMEELRTRDGIRERIIKGGGKEDEKKTLMTLGFIATMKKIGKWQRETTKYKKKRDLVK